MTVPRTLARIALALGVVCIGLAAAGTASAYTASCSGGGSLGFSGNTVTDGRSCRGTVTIPEGITIIGDYSFYTAGANYVTGVTLPSTLLTLESGAFQGTTNLTTITVPNNVTTIGMSAFYMSGLSSIVLGNSVSSIGPSAFINTPNLTSITFPSSVTSIGDNAFSGSSQLATIIFLGDAPVLEGTSVFAGVATGARASHSGTATGFTSTWFTRANLTEASVPGAPTGVSGTIANQQSVVSWVAPVSTGGSTITGYTTTANTGAFCSTSGATTCTITALNNGTAYTFSVTATNSTGTSAPSTASASVTPMTTASAPTSLIATAQNQAIDISFTAGADGGSLISNYQYRLNGSGSWTSLSPAGPTSPVTISGLTNGTAYTVELRAITGFGNGTASSATSSVTPMTTASAPTGLIATAQDQSIDISFTAGANGGSPISNYQYRLNGSGSWTPLSSADPTSPITISGLTNDTTYTVELRAITSHISPGAASTATSSVTPRPLAPNTPATPTALASDTQATITVTDGTGVGGTPVTYLVAAVSVSPDKTCTITVPATNCDVTGLQNGLSYTFTATATNTGGTSSASDPSAAVIPRAIPGAPTGVTATATNRSTVVSWTAPNSDGGSPITGYTVTSTPEGKTCTATAPELSCIVRDLTAGTTYTFTVSAATLFTTSLESSMSNGVTIDADPMAVPAPAPMVMKMLEPLRLNVGPLLTVSVDPQTGQLRARVACAVSNVDLLTACRINLYAYPNALQAPNGLDISSRKAAKRILIGTATKISAGARSLRVMIKLNAAGRAGTRSTLGVSAIITASATTISGAVGTTTKALSLRLPTHVVLPTDGIFDTSSWVPNAAGELFLKRLAAQLPAKVTSISCVGFTDDRGVPADNVWLGDQRADSICTSLASHGVYATQTHTSSRGAAGARATNATDAGRASNRRVEVALVYASH